MGRLGDYTYPDLDARAAVDISRILVDDFDGEAPTEEALAAALGHSTTRSGAFKGKMADARKWGVISARGIEATELAYRLASPADQNVERTALFEMHRNIEILRDLREQLGGCLPSADLANILKGMTGADPEAVKAAAPELRRLYSRMLVYEPDRDARGVEPVPGGGRGRLNTDDWDAIYVAVEGDTLRLTEVNRDNLALAGVFLDAKKREIEGRNGNGPDDPGGAE